MWKHVVLDVFTFIFFCSFSLDARASLPFQGIPVKYNLPFESNVTVSIFDRNGHLLRTLLKDSHRRAGGNTVFWDGKDQYGSAVPAGRYLVRGIWHPPITLKYMMTLDNPGAPPWSTPNGKGDWLSDEASPQGVATDGTNIYLASPGCEKGSAIIAVGPDGKRLWGFQEEAYPRCVSITCSGKYLYALFSGPVLTDTSSHFNGSNAIGRAFVVCLDKDAGTSAHFSQKNGSLVIARWPYVDHTAGLWKMRENKSFTPENYEGQTRYFANNVGEPTGAVGIAETRGKLYVSMLDDNKIMEYDSVSGSPIGDIAMQSPVGLHALPDGNLLIVSAGNVVRLNPADHSQSTLIDNHLDAPHDVTTDSQGNIYVSDWRMSFQVKVFTSQGKFLRAIGKPGGRPWIGKWERDGMLLPRGIAVTDSGRLWVAEDDASPNRVSVWNSTTGSLLRDYIGPAPYGGGANFWVDPKDAHTVLAAGALWHVDYTHKSSIPISTPFRRLSQNEPFTPSGMFGAGIGSRTLIHDGTEYIYVNTGSYSMLVFRREGMRLIPTMAMGCLGRYITTDGATAEVWDSDIGYHFISNYYPSFFRGHSGDNYVWVDRNGDGNVEPDEMQWIQTRKREETYTPGKQLEADTGWGFGFGPDGDIFFSGFCRDRTVVYRMDRIGWSVSGAPLYHLIDAKPIINGNASVQSISVGNDDHLYIVRPYEYNPDKNALDCYDRNGKLLWSIARPGGAQHADDVLADRVIGEFTEPGVGRIISTWLWHGNYKPYLLSSDGIYITSMLDETHLGPYANWDESYLQPFQTADGSAYLVNGGNDAYHILKIIGLNRIHRFQSALYVSAKQITDSHKKISSASASTAAYRHQANICVNYLLNPPSLNGDLSGWDMSDAVNLVDAKGRTARVALARDAAHLYLAYEVHGSRLVNKGGNRNTLFISGDCCDLMISKAPTGSHYSAQEGDERLLFSLFRGKPIAMLYQPVASGAASPIRLMGANIDRITTLTAANVVFHQINGGYIMEAAVPLSALGLNTISSIDTLCGDVGVIYADETGANRALRLYYYNHHTSVTSDLTTEATLQPGEWGDIKAPKGMNLLRNPGFEEPLATVHGNGWKVSNQKYGTAALSSGDAFCGRRALCLQETVPVTFTSESYNEPDYDKFVHSANEGKGGCYVEVTQQFAVFGGRSYDFQFHYRAPDMQPEVKKPGHPRGYDSLLIWLTWIGSDGRVTGREWICNIQQSQISWKEMLDSRAGYTILNAPYKAPAGSTSAILSLQLVGNAEGHMSKVYIDDLEFTEHERAN